MLRSEKKEHTRHVESLSSIFYLFGVFNGAL